MVAVMTGKPRRLTREQLARAQALVDAGYKVRDVAARFGVAPSQLNRYGVRARPASAGGEKAPRLEGKGRGGPLR